jgi:hypothetical protein
MKIFTSTEYYAKPQEVKELPKGQFLFRKGYVKIQEEGSKFATWSVYYINSATRKFIYVPFDELTKELQGTYKAMYEELYNKG